MTIFVLILNFFVSADIRFIDYIIKKLKETYVICKGFVLARGEFSVTLEKGANGINRSGSKKGDNLVAEDRATVHVKCR